MSQDSLYLFRVEKDGTISQMSQAKAFYLNRKDPRNEKENISPSFTKYCEMLPDDYRHGCEDMVNIFSSKHLKPDLAVIRTDDNFGIGGFSLANEAGENLLVQNPLEKLFQEDIPMAISDETAKALTKESEVYIQRDADLGELQASHGDSGSILTTYVNGKDEAVGILTRGVERNEGDFGGIEITSLIEPENRQILNELTQLARQGRKTKNSTVTDDSAEDGFLVIRSDEPLDFKESAIGTNARQFLKDPTKFIKHSWWSKPSLSIGTAHKLAGEEDIFISARHVATTD